MFVIVLFAIVSLCQAGLIPQEYSHTNNHGHGHATSYQHVKIENYHPVPVYLKKEHAHLLEHPVSKGHTATSLQVHHGGEHDHGYAIASGTHEQLLGHQGQHEEVYEQQGLGHGQEQDLGGYELAQGHGHAQQEQLQHEGNADAQLGHYSSADLAGHGLQAYATQDVDYGHGGQESSGYEHASAGYEQGAAGYEHGVEEQHQGHYQ